MARSLLIAPLQKSLAERTAREAAVMMVWSTVAAGGDGSVRSVEQRGGKVAVIIGSQTEYLDPPADKDIDAQAVVDLRRLLSTVGYEADAT
jgi:hypothetical protein